MKYGNINERRNQLHEVIRLSGMNLIIDDTDHPLIIKVASIQAARMQVYFIDNEDYFQRKFITEDENMIIPILSGPRMLMNRNLLYTAVTRARKCVTVVGSEETFREMINNEKQQRRYSSLDRRIQEAE